MTKTTQLNCTVYTKIMHIDQQLATGLHNKTIVSRKETETSNKQEQ